MISRPKPGETEDDLLKMQEEFLIEKNQNSDYQPAAQVVNLRRTEHQTTILTNINEITSRKASKYAVSKGLSGDNEKRSLNEANTSTYMGEIVEKNCESEDVKITEIDDDKVYFPKVLPSAIGEIIEKNVDRHIEDNNYIQIPSEGFPVVIICDPSITAGNKSIHAQQLEKTHAKNEIKINIEESPSHKPSSINQQMYTNIINYPSKSFILSSKDADSIHDENNEMLENMPEKDILEEQRILLSSLDPKLIEYIKNKHQRTTTKAEKQSAASSKLMDLSESISTEEVKTTDNEEKEMDASESISTEEVKNTDKEGIEMDQSESISTEEVKTTDNEEKEMDTSESISTEEVKNTDKEGKEMDQSESISTEEVKTADKEEKELLNDIFSNPDMKKWLHFDQLEKEKLEWMKSIEECEKIKPDKPYEARFDLNGYLLPYTMSYTEETKVLFHHGEEPHRPGYSIAELIELSRSNFTQQRVMALNTIAGILEFYTAGTFKYKLEIPITKLFFMIRIAMDENKTIILEPALKAMRNVFYNQIDEAALDTLIGYAEGIYQPCLENDKSEIEELESKESEFKDFQLAEIDLITALLRTDILQRLYYIMDIIKPSFNCVKYSLQILIRLCRDSESTVYKIIEEDHLMSVIINNFIPITSVNFRFDPKMVYKGKPILPALKFLRILSLQSTEIGHMLITKYGILEPLSEYICSKVDGTYGLMVQIEALNVLTNLLHFRLGIEGSLAIFPVVVTMLYNHVQGTDIHINTLVMSATHAAVIVQFINKLVQCNLIFDSYKHQMYPLLKAGVQKWLCQVAIYESFTCSHLTLACSILDCCASVLRYENITLPFLHIALKNLLKSPGFKEIMKHLVISSNLLSGIDSKCFHTIKNLVSLNSIVIGLKQNNLPIINMTSPIPFLASLSKVISIINVKKISNGFIKHVLNYLKKFASKTPSLCDNWFTRMEIDFVFYTVKIASQYDITDSEKDLIYTVANKLCYVLRADKRSEFDFLFNEIIFNKQWFSSARLLGLLSLSEKDGITNIFTNPDDIKCCYGKFINLIYTDNKNVVLREWKEPILPRDWIYLPILTLYSKSQELKSTPKVVGEHANRVAEKEAKEKELIVSSSLEWILFNELCFPDILQEIDVTDRFCRIMSVFLCDNSLFLEPSIKLLLHKCTEVLFKSRDKFDFDKDLIGLNNFQDFYMQLLDQFQGVSYGDPCFAACVLVPLAQKHNVEWRKMLWSEYAGCLRALDCPDNYLCYELNDYLDPEEYDESLLKCYFRALNSNLLRKGTIVYKIAEHHVNKFKLRKTPNV